MIEMPTPESNGHAGKDPKSLAESFAGVCQGKPAFVIWWDEKEKRWMYFFDPAMSNANFIAAGCREILTELEQKIRMQREFGFQQEMMRIMAEQRHAQEMAAQLRGRGGM